MRIADPVVIMTMRCLPQRTGVWLANASSMPLMMLLCYVLAMMLLGGPRRSSTEASVRGGAAGFGFGGPLDFGQRQRSNQNSLMKHIETIYEINIIVSISS
jgi:hypothetical protein